MISGEETIPLYVQGLLDTGVICIVCYPTYVARLVYFSLLLVGNLGFLFLSLDSGTL